MSASSEMLPAGIPLGLVGDIGGTNCRLALAAPGPEGPRLFKLSAMKCADYPTAEAGISHYLATTGAPTPTAAVLAVAGPVLNGKAHLTNAVWNLEESALHSALGIGTVRLMNDFAATSMSTLVLGQADLVHIGPPARGRAGATIAVMGPGTGFGMSALAGGKPEGLLVTEGGHVGFAPTGEDELDLLRVMLRRFDRVSVERVLSGHGMENLHAARAELAGAPPPGMDAASITQAAANGDAYAAATVQKFCDILASVAGDFALALGAQGGVFIAGGILPRLLAGLDHATFRTRFENKGRFASYLQAIPINVITARDANLRGAAHALAGLTS